MWAIIIGFFALMFFIAKLIHAEQRYIYFDNNTGNPVTGAEDVSNRSSRRSRLSLHRNHSNTSQKKWRDNTKNKSASRSPSLNQSLTRHRKASQPRFSPYICTQVSSPINTHTTTPANPMEKYRKRLYIISELLKTEISYVGALESINSLVLEPLICSSKNHEYLLDKKITNMIFSNFQDILNVNKEFLRQLLERLVDEQTRNDVESKCFFATANSGFAGAVIIDLKQWNPVRDIIADIFVNMAPFFKMYSVYVKNFTSALETLESQLRTNPAFRSFVNDIKAKNAEFKNKDLGFFLIMPVQRIPRYRLLLQDLLYSTPMDHSDNFHITKALYKIESVANFVNEQIRLQENAIKIYEIQQKLVGFVDSSGRPASLIQPGRVLLKQGFMKKICIKDCRRRIFFLFNDILVYAIPRNSYLLFGSVIEEGPRELFCDFAFRHAFCVSGIEIVDIKNDQPVNVGLNQLKHVQHFKNSFLVLSSEKSIQVVCETEEEKACWLESIYSAIEKSSKEHRQKKSNKNYMSPVWLPDEYTFDCMTCGVQFNILRRKHHCRNCGLIICQQCSSKKLKLPQSRNLQRVCDVCFIEKLSSITTDKVKGNYEGFLPQTAIATDSCVDNYTTFSCINGTFSSHIMRLSKTFFDICRTGAAVSSTPRSPGNESHEIQKQ